MQSNEKQLLYKILKVLGLSTNEQRLFVLSLHKGPSAPAKLAKELGISRPNIYKIIEGLEKRGLATRSGVGRYTKKFVVHSPSRIAERLSEKRTRIENLDESLASILPQLIASYEQESERPVVKIYERDQFDETFELMLRETRSEILFFGSIGDMVYYTSPTTQTDFIKRRIKQKIYARALLLPSRNTDRLRNRDSEELRETRVLNEIDEFHTTFQLFANKALIWQPQASIAILIEDQFIVEMFSSIFDYFWKTSKNHQG